MVPKSNTHAASGIGTYDDMNAIARLCVAQRHCDVLRSNRGAYMKLSPQLIYHSREQIMLLLQLISGALDS